MRSSQTNRVNKKRFRRKVAILAILLVILALMIVVLVTVLKRTKDTGDAGFFDSITETNGSVIVDKVPAATTISEINPLFVGDSRTVGLGEFVEGLDIKAKNGATIYLLYDLEKTIRDSGADCIVVGFGVNDLGDIDDYISFVNTLGEELTKPIYFLTVNPVEEQKAASNGYSVKNSNIDKFNSKLIDGAQTYAVIDTNGYLSEEGFGTVDGLHYDEETYKKIYEYVIWWIETWG